MLDLAWLYRNGKGSVISKCIYLISGRKGNNDLSGK